MCIDIHKPESKVRFCIFYLLMRPWFSKRCVKLMARADSVQMPIRLREITSAGLSACCQFPSKLRVKCMTMRNLCPINKKLPTEKREGSLGGGESGSPEQNTRAANLLVIAKKSHQQGGKMLKKPWNYSGKREKRCVWIRQVTFNIPRGADIHAFK